MPPPKRMTANPSRPARYRPGKATAADSNSSSEDEGEDSNAEQEQETSAPAPSASSFPKTVTSNLKNVDINARKAAVREEAARKAQGTAINEDEFETEEESGAGSGGDRSESEEEEGYSEEEESSSEDDVATRRKLIRPVFIKKGARTAVAAPVKTDEERWAEEESRKKEKANELVEAQLEKNALAKAAGKKFWDDEDIVEDDVDDTDGLDPEAERAAWKLRELTRVKRDRDALIAAEKEREEIERRRNLTKDERDAEDKEYLDNQQAERDGKGKMGFMQKYFHKGAYFTEDLQDAGLDKRDIMGGHYADDVANRDTLPEYMQIRDMTKLGKKGRTRYKDMKSEDTGRFADYGGGRGRGRGGGGGDRFGGDERFRPDWDCGGRGDGPSGANASLLGERKRHAPDERGGEKRARVDYG
ncbi:hypothetical protein EJ08DRAFT_650656 [Tothia fuscella]|uniref:Micro-fibrillar-associated protein 1 C-terminal domain-containing protein n=1 Tax=Tothia fuscella TaxID=1048955 RepID=A0A9P4NPF4_9PEZI|nr:hypothetical protein EJ08DRAFT_650656 [Tothia fuscella]